ncbi:hypothetical protein SU69_05505 [Thermosipho melanesiensis]|uniref:DUF2922 domain-containing protein n=2 Tax=Thermosipho melanesiensis TaxID=46541 RepID=A6LLY7_THEM4|nr:DUF2922 domain-containing protein [Thermosipho melanesiensis]ABR30938.1 hypothetical protein Tmel_1078 [Thermosipho melanesiensis BI429]APT74051.1 hypothetical protein BW47_05765 [Thermosipho melanesiensis]OOC35982.1 hypothetical protein SU68_05565 [Thermosipho melanesiensis]OOC38121.1 hypothetical protein SU69_05505 [Thermosipho melanesiensis]OOC38250.1 hypothetical protein SU70_05515 [Thermosipho melanesiensis]
MKRLSLVYRNASEGKTLRVNLSDPIDNINTTELEQDAQSLIDNGLVPAGYVFDEARVVETNTNVVIDLIQ